VITSKGSSGRTEKTHDFKVEILEIFHDKIHVLISAVGELMTAFNSYKVHLSSKNEPKEHNDIKKIPDFWIDNLTAETQYSFYVTIYSEKEEKNFNTPSMNFQTQPDEMLSQILRDPQKTEVNSARLRQSLASGSSNVPVQHLIKLGIHHINIDILGPSGSGKSFVWSTIKSAMMDKSNISGGVKKITNKTRTKLSNYISLADTPGWQQIGNKSTNADSSSPSIRQLVDLEGTHAVIIVMSYLDYINKSFRFDTLNQYYHDLLNEGYNPLVVISNCDKILPYPSYSVQSSSTYLTSPINFWCAGAVTSILGDIAEKSSIPRPEFFPFTIIAYFNQILAQKSCCK